MTSMLFAAAVLANLKVVATTGEYGALASAIGGPRIAVTVLAKPTEDPHFVDAKPSHLVTLNKADVLIQGGAELEQGWLPPLLEGARNAKILPGSPGHVKAGEGVTLIDVPAALDRSQGDLHGAGNPHFMMDPGNARIVARHLAEVFCAADAGSCADYRTGLAAFEQALDGRLAAWTARLAPFRGTPITTYHPTWKYFAARFGLVSDVFLEPKPGIPPSPPHLAEVITAMTSRRIPIVLVEPFQSRKTAEAVASRTGATVVSVGQFPGSLPGTEGDYLKLMDANVEAIASALEKAKGR
ncbi:MAG TPA: metal ABC transporter substrate-binding protein [Candidatus Polarisedimenticolaceae bacterium]